MDSNLIEDILKSPEDLIAIDKQLQELRLDPSQLEHESQTDIIETLNFYNDVLDKLETAQVSKILTQAMLDERIGRVKSEKHQLEIYLAKNIQLPEPVRHIFLLLFRSSPLVRAVVKIQRKPTSFAGAHPPTCFFCCPTSFIRYNSVD